MSGKQRLVNYLLLIIVVFYRPLSAYLEIVFSQTFFSLRVSDHGCHVSFHQVPQHLLQTWLEKKKKEPFEIKYHYQWFQFNAHATANQRGAL